MSRIIAGQAAGRRLVPVKGDQTRPTTDRVKEALFSRLESWEALSEARVADLFAGSGALGLEAASRGAANVVFVDKSPVAYAALTANVKALDSVLGADLRTYRQSAETFAVSMPAQSFDLIFIDPPYDMADRKVNELLEVAAPLLAPDGVIVIERGKRADAPTWPDCINALKPRTYGETTLYFADRPLT
ncbi:16S rRNA (guanine(966)-N(2))-methyltransferase RsmD [Micrococcoides hystricis]|uniref:16S rRNA (Guanine(966)-N(2))-methyltransferase RsmD n=1 Tax=Micrococcoides hystricis TaxID=1572761 RepID=A0ABV6PC16_9MICC